MCAAIVAVNRLKGVVISMKTYRKVIIFYCTSLIVGFIGAIIFRELDIVPRKIGFVVFFIPLSVIALLISRYYDRRQTKKIYDVLVQECNTKDYILYYEIVLKKRSKSRTRNGILVNLCTGYLIDGNVEESKRILNIVRGFPSTKSGAAWAVCHINNLVAYYLMVNDLERANNALDSMKEALVSPKLDKKYYESYNSAFTNKSFILNIARGNYSGAEEHLNMSFEKEKTLIGKVKAKYYLGELYIHLNDSDKATSAFAYVIQNGNQTYYTQKAREYLESDNMEKHIVQDPIEQTDKEEAIEEYCRSCGRDIDKSYTFCKHCGASVNEKQVYRKTARVALLCLFICSFFTLFFALGLVALKTNGRQDPALGSAYMIENMWLFFVPVPIPLSSLILGIIYKRKGYKATKNIVVGIIFTTLLSIYGSFPLLLAGAVR